MCVACTAAQGDLSYFPIYLFSALPLLQLGKTSTCVGLALRGLASFDELPAEPPWRANCCQSISSEPVGQDCIVAVWERPSALKVLDFAMEAGLLTRAERARLDVETTEPAVVSPQPDKDTQTLTQQLQAKIVSLDTVRQKLGYDPQHEAEGVKKDAASQQPPGGGAPGGAPPEPGAAAPDGGGGDDPLAGLTPLTPRNATVGARVVARSDDGKVPPITCSYYIP
jgi:hypothetical protein